MESLDKNKLKIVEDRRVQIEVYSNIWSQSSLQPKLHLNIRTLIISSILRQFQQERKLICSLIARKTLRENIECTLVLWNRLNVDRQIEKEYAYSFR